MRAKLALAALVIFTLLCGSICATTCALGTCPIETQNSATHDCDHGASGPSHHSSPQNPDCPTHHHPTFDAVKADALSQLQLSSTGTASELLAVTARREAFSVSGDARSQHLASPPNFNIPLDQQISVLRI
jgi:hypothetical protein